VFALKFLALEVKYRCRVVFLLGTLVWFGAHFGYISAVQIHTRVCMRVPIQVMGIFTVTLFQLVHQTNPLLPVLSGLVKCPCVALGEAKNSNAVVNHLG
jgi:hypothetical protein